MDNNDLISRAAAVAEIEEYIEEYSELEPETGYHNLKWCAMEEAKDVLSMLPAVDAVPVVHGRWVKVSGYVTPGGDPVWKCSECGKGVHVYGIEHGTYGADIADGQWISCPNCGAKMDGENAEINECDSREKEGGVEMK